MSAAGRSILWWGRFDPDYSRNRVLRSILSELGYTITDFHPRISSLARLEAWLKRIPTPDLVWVPCFRQRDLAAAHGWARRRGVPLVFDPLISAWDKQVLERHKFTADSSQAHKLLRHETRLFNMADLVLADTRVHASFFVEKFGLTADSVMVVPVGAEEELFYPETEPQAHGRRSLDILFYGSYIPLQGPQTIIRAAHLYQGPKAEWTLIGDGPLRAECEELARGSENIHFEDWLDYNKLPERIRHADILLGIFGTTEKAARVIPNKAYQALACGKPLVTMLSPAWPEEVKDSDCDCLKLVQAGDPRALADAINALAHNDCYLQSRTRNLYEQFFSKASIRNSLQQALDRLERKS